MQTTPRTRGRKWLRIRARQLRRHPLCARCLRAGHVTEATEVDHIVRVADGGTDDPSNLQSLCHECHADKTARENGCGHPTGCDADGMPLDPLHPWFR
ncbi:HNH endonuclease [Paraburkholderia adhaesiva]|uniref:HNH endonuclease n=1 Tax=Paraburkholderia adhaesiva TaxID=2883244 RepID=UPI001F26808E|nr:HNH endonuclease signature motif containing protein [Paraburkholderia adhaesiva]